MSYVYKKKIANRKNYGGKRSLSKIKWIVLHFTGNNGDTDENNGNYFANNIVKASAHYFVDSDSVTQSVPDNYIAWSVGGNKYGDCKTTGGGKYYGKCINSNSISIELCDDIKNGKVYPSQATIDNAIELAKKLMKKYNIPASHVIRHFDVVGKKCPAYWCGSSRKDKLWKTEFHNKLGDSTPPKPSKPTIEEDGYWGINCTKASQRFLGTPVDGEVDGQYSPNKKYLPNATSGWHFASKAKGSTMIKALQRIVGVKADGIAGKGTIIALQKFLNKKGYKLTVDGIMGKSTVKAWQDYLNKHL